MSHRESDDEGEVTAGQGMKAGFTCLAVGTFFFVLLSLMESSGHGGQVHWLVAALYYIGGRWGVAGFFGLGALFFFGYAYRANSRDDE